VDGNSAAIADQDFEVENTPRQYTDHVDLTIGSDVPGSPPGQNPGGSGGVLGGSATSCASPKLSMLLSQKPVRVRKGAVVLVRGKKYRFTGRLTCLVRDKRVSAPKKTKIQAFAIVKGRTTPKGTALVGSGGRIAIRLASPSARTLEFRFRSADGKIARVRIKVQTVEPPRKHKHR
jgi:hypothetical protein